MARRFIAGTRPTSYLGVTAQTPPNFEEYDRVPNQNDSKLYEIGDLWLFWDNSFTPRRPRLFVLVSLAGNANKVLIADWREFDFSGGGGADLERITGDISTGFGSAQAVTGDPNNQFNLNMFGATDLQFDGDPATYTFQVTNKVKVSQYVVGPVAYQWRFTSIQAAIDQAVLDGANSASQPAVVFITAGVYVGDITLADGVYLVGHQGSRSFPTSTVIDGHVTINTAGTFGLFCLGLQADNAGNLITVSSAATQTILMQNCTMTTTAPATDIFVCTNANATVYISDCNLVRVGANCLNLTTGNYVIRDTILTGNVTATNLGLFQMSDTDITGPVTMNGTNTQIMTFTECTFNESLVTFNNAANNVYLSGCLWQNISNLVALAVNNTAEINLNSSIVRSNAAGAEWATGVGTIHINTVSVVGTAQNIAAGLTRTGEYTWVNSLDMNTTSAGTPNNGVISWRGSTYIHTRGTASTFVGAGAGNLTNTGISNNVFGDVAGTAITTGERNLLLGSGAGINYTTETDNVAIFNSGTAAANNQIFMGGTFGTGSGQTTDTWINGRVRKPETNAFDSYNASGITGITGDGTTYTMILPDVSIDQRGDYNPATGVFTCSKEGLYYFDAKVSLLSIDVTNTDTDILFNFTGSVDTGSSRIITIGNLGAQKSSGNAYRVSGSVLEYLEVGDTCFVTIFVDGFATPNVDLGGSQFGGWLVA